jgi:FAD/FMN-containing dehydrogenase
MPTAPLLDQSAFDQLKPQIRGALLMPADPGYDTARALWNGMIDRRPAGILRCIGTSDVIAGVNFARTHGVPISIKGGGHNIAGLGMCDGGLALDLSLMRGVWVDRARRVVRAQAGCLLGDVDRETQLHGLAAVLGFVSNTGIAGLTLGGGFGYLTRLHGWTCDTVLAFDMVTADGRVVRATESENPDLFWALRGGGGNFGVVTAIEYELFPIGPEVYAGAVAWPVDQAPLVIDEYMKLVDGPPESACVMGFRIAPPAPWLAKDIHGKPIVLVAACHAGSVEDGERRFATLKRVGTPVGDVLQRRSYVSQQALLDATQPAGRRYYWKSEYLANIDSTLLSAVRDEAASIPSPHSAILVFPLDGQLNTLPAGHSPAGNRNARAVLNVAASWDKPADDASNVEWARSAWTKLRRFSTGGVYVNFLTEEETGDRLKQAYGDHLVRLAEIKAAWDPGNLFRVNKNVAPAGGGHP